MSDDEARTEPVVPAAIQLQRPKTKGTRLLGVTLTLSKSGSAEAVAAPTPWAKPPASAANAGGVGGEQAPPVHLPAPAAPDAKRGQQTNQVAPMPVPASPRDAVKQVEPSTLEEVLGVLCSAIQRKDARTIAAVATRLKVLAREDETRMEAASLGLAETMLLGVSTCLTDVEVQCNGLMALRNLTLGAEAAEAVGERAFSKASAFEVVAASMTMHASSEVQEHGSGLLAGLCRGSSEHAANRRVAAVSADLLAVLVRALVPAVVDTTAEDQETQSSASLKAQVSGCSALRALFEHDDGRPSEQLSLSAGGSGVMPAVLHVLRNPAGPEAYRAARHALRTLASSHAALKEVANKALGANKLMSLLMQSAW